MIKTAFRKYFELAFWVAAMVSLALTNPADQSHFSLCPFKMMGITLCPGCGLGHSICYLFHGYILRSIQAHWLGIPAAGVIFYRICYLARLRFGMRREVLQ